MGLFNTHIDFNPFNGGFDPTPFLNLGVTQAAKNVTPVFGVSGTSNPQLTVSSVGSSQSGTSQSAPINRTPVLGASTTGPSNTSSGSGSAATGTSGPTISAAQQAANDQAIAIANAALGRIPGQVQTAQDQVRHLFSQNQNELQSGYDAAHQNYNQSTGQNTQQFVTNKNQINNMGSQGLLGLLRTLGQHGAGGSSAALFAAPDAVNQFVTQQRSGAGQTYGQNQQTLDTNWGNYQTGFDNSKKQLNDWLSQQLDAAQSQGEQNKMSLLQTIASLQSSPDAAQPYIDQINAAANRVDQLAKFNPTYTGKSPVYNAPDVASYTVDQAGSPVLGTPGNGTSGMTPALAYLLGINKDKQQQNQFAF